MNDEQKLEAWKDSVKKKYPNLANKMKFKLKPDTKEFSAEVDGQDRCYGVYNHKTGKGQVLENILRDLLELNEAISGLLDHDNEILTSSGQDSFKKEFNKKYKFKEFYFDDADLVDKKTSKTIVGVKLNKSKVKDFVNALITHFNLKT